MTIRRLFLLTTLLLPIASVALEDITLPPGFSIEEYADVPNARSLALGERGTVFVSNRKGRSVYAVIPENSGTRTVRLTLGMNLPNGIAIHDGDLYVAEIDKVTRFKNIEDQLDNVPAGEVLDIDLPSERHHGWRYIGFGPDNKLYISVGAPCNVCDEPGFGEIDRMDPDGSNRETYASGVRNSVGFTWHPGTGELWFTDNGRDMMGDDMPADELNRAARQGMHFGFPHCHAGEILDPRFGEGDDCAHYSAPERQLGAHVAPLGLTFYTGEQFPTEYYGHLFIAEHGSWNRSKKAGYRVMLVKLQDGEPVSYEPFAEGWLQNQSVSGRPVDLLQLADGSIIVSDDFAGKLFRISYQPPTTNNTVIYE